MGWKECYRGDESTWPEDQQFVEVKTRTDRYGAVFVVDGSFICGFVTTGDDRQTIVPAMSDKYKEYGSVEWRVP